MWQINFNNVTRSQTNLPPISRSQKLMIGNVCVLQIKEGLHAAFKNAYTKLTGMIADNSMLKNLDENTDKKINAVVGKKID